MNDPVAFPVIVLDGDREISTINMLHQAMEKAVQYHSLSVSERHRIAAWFASRYGAQPAERTSD